MTEIHNPASPLCLHHRHGLRKADDHYPRCNPCLALLMEVYAQKMTDANLPTWAAKYQAKATNLRAKVDA